MVRLDLSRPVRTILGIGLLVLLAAVVLMAAFYLLPLLAPENGVGEAPLAPKSPGITRTQEAAPPEPRSQQTAGLAAPTGSAARPTLLAGSGAIPSEPTVTPLPRGSGEPLPHTSTGLPWPIPVGLIALLILTWWRWQRLQTAD